MSSDWSSLRRILRFFNAAFLITSFAFIKFGLVSLYIIVLMSNVSNLENHHVALSPLLAVVIGVSSLIIVFFRFCITFHPEPTQVKTYSLYLGILAIVELFIGAFTLNQFGSYDLVISDSLKFDLNIKFQSYEHNPLEMDKTQELLHCCGINGPDDWIINKTTSHLTIPTSCCKNLEMCDGFQSIYTEGCVEVYLHFVFDTNIVIGTAFILVATIQMSVTIVQLILSYSYRRRCGEYVYVLLTICCGVCIDVILTYNEEFERIRTENTS